MKAFEKIVLFLIFLAPAFAGAGDRLPPSAPSNYLEKSNPLLGKKDAFDRGAKLFERKCKKCHGEKGDGLGPSGKGLEPTPAAFSKPGYLKERKDGQLYWIIENGSSNTAMDPYGPGTENNLSPDDIWSLVTFIKSKFQN